jgi:hypothetical protein
LLIICIAGVAPFADADATEKVIELQLGQPVDLRQFGGPNINLAVTDVDISDVSVTLQDYDRMQVSGGGNDYTGYSVSSHATATRIRVKKVNGAVLYSWSRGAVVYLSASQNRVNIAVVSE